MIARGFSHAQFLALNFGDFVGLSLNFLPMKILALTENELEKTPKLNNFQALKLPEKKVLFEKYF